jgi:opacity protein-like surface antigen
MEKIFRACVVPFAAAMLAVPALAQTGSAYTRQQRGMSETFRLDVGGFFQKFATSVRVGDGLGNPGTNVSFESLLGAPDSQTNVFADGYWRWGPRASLQFAYRHANRSSSRVVSTDVQFGDQTYQAGGKVDTSIRLDVGELYYAYALVNNGDAEFALMLGVSAFSNKVSFDASGSIAGPGGAVTVQSDSRNLLAPVPAVGAYFRYALYPKFFAWGKVKGLTATISGRHGSLLTWGAGLDLYFTQHVGIGGGYEYVKLVFEKRDTRQFALDYEYKGPTAYVSIVF